MTRVLVIDDDHAQRFLFAQLLKRVGFDVATSNSGDMALEMLLTDSRFDVILTDLMMPGINAEFLIQELRQDYPHIPIVLMSVIGLSEWSDQSVFSPMIYLRKPFDRHQLEAAILQAVNGDHSTSV